MGYGNWSRDAFDHLASTRKSKPVGQIFTSQGTPSDMTPKGLKVREARDSDNHPESVAVAVFLDVTGSMGEIPERLARGKLTQLMETMIQHGVAHPQILFGAIGDHHCDRAPLQIGQFESSHDTLDKWLTSAWLEAGGGGQNMESYLLAWYVAARHTSCDCFEKRGQKSFLFTIGDEATWPEVDATSMKAIFDFPETSKITAKDLLEELERSYHVFHIRLTQGQCGKDSHITNLWKELLGERLLMLDDYEAVAETIATTVVTVCGADLNKVVQGMDANVGGAVSRALMPLSKNLPAAVGGRTGIVRL